MNKRYIDGNESFGLVDQARHDREILLKRRSEVEVLIHNLYARQIALQESYNLGAGPRDIVDIPAIHREVQIVNEKEKTSAEDERIRLNSEESSVLHKREKAATERNRLASVRSEILRKREKAADERGEIADQRDKEADKREKVQNALDKALSERERQLSLAQKLQDNQE